MLKTVEMYFYLYNLQEQLTELQAPTYLDNNRILSEQKRESVQKKKG